MPQATRILAISSKEMQHVLHDQRTLVILFLMPLLQLIIFGYAMNMELRHAPVGIVDYAQNVHSRDLVSKLDHNDYLAVREYTCGTEPETLFGTRLAQAVLVIPAGFGSSTMDMQLLLDASDANNAQLIQSYVSGILADENGIKLLPLDMASQIMFNPELKSSYFFVPGLIAMILVMICALLTSISITREKELGTLEQLLVSPVSASEILLGKVVPYIALALMDTLLILGVGLWMFHVPFVGNVFVFIIFTLLYILAALCLGLLISTVAKTQQAAMMMALAATLLPTLMLSGFMFPIRSMPWILRQITYVVPARYYLQIIRGIMLKGNSVVELWQSGLILAGMSMFLLFIAIRRFSLRLR